jgi:BON domain
LHPSPHDGADNEISYRLFLREINVHAYDISCAQHKAIASITVRYFWRIAMQVNLSCLVAQATFAIVGASVFASAHAAGTASTAQQALAAQMEDAAKDLTVDLSQGVANISGWVVSPLQADQARCIVSQIPGVHRAYSTRVHTWSTDSSY